MISFLLFMIGFLQGIPYDDIEFMMPVYVEPDYREGYYIVMLVILKEGVDIPGELGYYSALYDRIVIEKQGLKPANYYQTCFSVLWHEILHARYGGSEKEDHLKMRLEKQCA